MFLYLRDLTLSYFSVYFWWVKKNWEMRVLLRVREFIQKDAALKQTMSEKRTLNTSLRIFAQSQLLPIEENLYNGSWA